MHITHQYQFDVFLGNVLLIIIFSKNKHQLSCSYRDLANYSYNKIVITHLKIRLDLTTTQLNL